ncbi:MAG: TlpA family protein disulfide reductase [Clostridium sp.]|uniref:TlpA family protein disulfide reductase n=1 Tax=Clostridium sp. TaxID=1506 RepID=UPI003EE5CCF6
MKKIILIIILICVVIGGVEYYKISKNKENAQKVEISQNNNEEQGNTLNEDNWNVKPNDVQENQGFPAIKDTNFKLKNLNGEEVSLSQYKGKKVFINFWASWCPPCKDEMPDLEKLYKEYGDKIVILTINAGETREKAENFIKEKNYTFPVLLDSNMEVSAEYGARYLPTSVMINEKGDIVNYRNGAMDYAQMKEFIQERTL